MLELKKTIWFFLHGVDKHLNHGFFELLVDSLPETEFTFWLWENTSGKFCNWIVINLYEKWFNEYNKELR